MGYYKAKLVLLGRRWIMKVFNYSVLVITLHLTVACASIETKNAPVTLQAIDFMEEGYFLEGARFEVIKQQNGCLLKGTGYGETGKNDYRIYFDSNSINQAHYTSYRYKKPIYDVKSDADMFIDDKVTYGDNIDKDDSILTLFEALKQLITPENLARCTSL